MKTGGDTIDVVDEFVNLRTSITKHRNELKDIRMSIEQANLHITPSLFPLRKSREVHRQTKIKL